MSRKEWNELARSTRAVRKEREEHARAHQLKQLIDMHVGKKRKKSDEGLARDDAWKWAGTMVERKGGKGEEKALVQG